MPRIDGPARVALVELQYDEFGAGRPAALHSRLFADAAGGGGRPLRCRSARWPRWRCPIDGPPRVHVDLDSEDPVAAREHSRSLGATARWDRPEALVMESPGGLVFCHSRDGRRELADDGAPEFDLLEEDGRVRILLQRLGEQNGRVRAHLDLATDDRDVEMRRHELLGAELVEVRAPGPR